MALREIYKTIAAPCEGIYKEKGSKFLAFAFPVSTEDQIKEHLQLLKKDYFDARHHCYAYRLGAEGELWRANDNGEPSSTAGKPILGQLLSRDLSDTLVIVIRYFGGIKLGVSGLINAYRAAAQDALDKAQVIDKQVKEQVTLRFSYDQMQAVMKAIKETQGNILQQSFLETDPSCLMVVEVLPSQAAQLASSIKKYSTPS